MALTKIGKNFILCAQSVQTQLSIKSSENPNIVQQHLSFSLPLFLSLSLSLSLSFSLSLSLSFSLSLSLSLTLSLPPPSFSSCLSLSLSLKTFQNHHKILLWIVRDDFGVIFVLILKQWTKWSDSSILDKICSLNQLIFLIMIYTSVPRFFYLLAPIVKKMDCYCSRKNAV